MSNPGITLANKPHHDKAVVSLSFEKDYGLIGKVMSPESLSWSQNHKFWYILQRDFKVSGVFEKLSSLAFLDNLDLGYIQEIFGHNNSKTT